MTALRQNSEHAYVEVIGDPVAQSKSPAIHRFWIDRLGLDADYRAHRVTGGELEAYVEERKKDPAWRGCNVTMPHKQAIVLLLDRLDPLAERIGAVNTVVREANGTLTGYNTDASGFLEPLEHDLEQQHLFRMARIVGTGGAARAIVVALADRGFTLVVAGRDPLRAQALLAELAPGDHHPAPLSHFASPTDFAFDNREGCYDLVVNASPLGMQGKPPLALHMSHVPPRSVVYDIVTSPARTALLASAEEAGFRTVDGLSMLIGQAAEAFSLFFGIQPPRRDDAALRARLLA